MDSYTRAAINAPRDVQPAPAVIRIAGTAALFAATAAHLYFDVFRTIAFLARSVGF